MTWEQKKIGPSGNVMLQEKLKVKYVGLKLDENEGERKIFTIHAVQFVREHRKKYHRIVAVMIAFDTTVSVEENDDSVQIHTTAFVLTKIFVSVKIT